MQVTIDQAANRDVYIIKEDMKNIEQQLSNLALGNIDYLTVTTVYPRGEHITLINPKMCGKVMFEDSENIVKELE